MKLGETVTRATHNMGDRQFVVTQMLNGGTAVVLTPIPEGMTVADLGRRFTGAMVEFVFTCDCRCERHGLARQCTCFCPEHPVFSPQED